MSTVVVIDGPEKAGKSTLIKAFKKEMEACGRTVNVTRWGPVDPDDRVYTDVLKANIRLKNGAVQVWDRAWPSEHVYGKLLNRQRRLAHDPWLGEWLHGRALYRHGVRAILLPSVWVEAATRRDKTDLMVNPADEFDAYKIYAETYGWHVLRNDYSQLRLASNVNRLMDMVSFAEVGPLWTDPDYMAGPNTRGRVLVVGEARNMRADKTMPGAWLPFTSRKTTEFVRRYFGAAALGMVWTNAEDVRHGRVPPAALTNAGAVIALGNAAAEALGSVGARVDLALAHPGFFMRWNTPASKKAREEFENAVPRILGEALKVR